MTKEELKAKELFEIYNRVGLQQRDEAKECALICVDKIIEVLDELWFLHCDDNNNEELKEFWQEVKQILTDKY